MRSNQRDHSRKDRITALLAELWQQGIRDEPVLTAIAHVPRERFVAAEDQENAWANVALPIGAGQTISQPYVVALMTHAMNLSGTEHVLEVGTGSGYQTAILCQLAGTVVSIERHSVLAKRATALLAELGCTNVAVHTGDGSTGRPESAPFDRIMVTAAAPRPPRPLLDQLGAAGRIVIPIGEPNNQQLVAIDRAGAEFRETELGLVRFVPLIGRDGWAAPAQSNGHERE